MTLLVSHDGGRLLGGQERLEPGEVLTYGERLDAQLAPGRYTVTGLLVARSGLLQATAEFAVVER